MTDEPVRATECQLATCRDSRRRRVQTRDEVVLSALATAASRRGWLSDVPTGKESCSCQALFPARPPQRRGPKAARPPYRLRSSKPAARGLRKSRRLPCIHLLSTTNGCRATSIAAPAMCLFVNTLINACSSAIAPRDALINYLVGTASDTSAKAAFAHSSSFCTVGAPLSPIAPTTSPFTLMGNPPPHAATRGSVGIPAKSDGSPWMKLKKSCVETPNSAVYALFCAISMERIGAPSIRLKALRLPPSSRIATFSATPIFLAFATA